MSENKSIRQVNDEIETIQEEENGNFLLFTSTNLSIHMDDETDADDEEDVWRESKVSLQPSKKKKKRRRDTEDEQTAPNHDDATNSANTNRNVTNSSRNRSDSTQQQQRNNGQERTQNTNRNGELPAQNRSQSVGGTNYALVPIGNNLVNRSMMRRTNPIPLSTLMNEDQQNIPRATRLNVQLLRVIANANGINNTPMLRYVGARNLGNNNQRGNGTTNYSRLFLCRVVNEQQSRQHEELLYVMEARNTNDKLWNKNPQFRDNEVITVVTVFRIMNPLSVKKLMSDELSMIEIRFPVIVMKIPLYYHEVTINYSIKGNTCRPFVLNSCRIQILSSTPEDTECAGLFCDKQRVNEIREYSQKCGCYHMLGTRSNLVIDHSLSIEHPDWSFHVEKYSSSQFSKNYMSGYFPSGVNADEL